MKRQRTMKSTMRDYDAQNKEAAQIILQHPEKYSGIMRVWALALLLRLETEAVEPYPLLHQIALGEQGRAA